MSLNIYVSALQKKINVTQLQIVLNILVSNYWSLLGLFLVDLSVGLLAFSSSLCFSYSCGIQSLLHLAVPVHHPACHAAVLTFVTNETVIIWFAMVLIFFVLWINE